MISHGITTRYVNAFSEFFCGKKHTHSTVSQMNDVFLFLEIKAFFKIKQHVIFSKPNGPEKRGLFF